MAAEPTYVMNRRGSGGIAPNVSTSTVGALPTAHRDVPRRTGPSSETTMTIRPGDERRTTRLGRRRGPGESVQLTLRDAVDRPDQLARPDRAWNRRVTDRAYHVTAPRTAAEVAQHLEPPTTSR
jgi:hypothetical protein